MGAGNRSGFRDIINWLANEPSGKLWLKANLDKIPEYGRWDDLKVLYNTGLESEAMTLWSNAIKEGNALAAKWADAQDVKMRNFLNMTPKQFRKFIVNTRKGKIVESLMCKKKWDEIEYSKVPSVAIGRYNTAFNRNDGERYNNWRHSLVKVKDDGTMEVVGDVKAGAIFPHDLVRTVLSETGNAFWQGSKPKEYSKETEKLVEAQFQSMPNYYDVTERKIMTILDTSGSMYTPVAGSIQAVDVALGLSLYCSDRLGKDNPFYRKIIPFSSTASLKSWDNMTFAKAVGHVPDGYVGSTNIISALNLLLESAKLWSIEVDKMPNCLLIISDMQFDQQVEEDNMPIEDALNKWVEAGYNKPQIIYWNLMGYNNQPATKYDKNVGMVSGYSPSTMKAVLEGDDFTPLAIMKRTIAAYPVNEP